MAISPHVYEKQANGTLLLLSLVGEFQGLDNSNAPMYGPIQVSDIGDPTEVHTPDAPSLTASLPTRTTSSLVWTAPQPNGGPPITAYHVERATDAGAFVEVAGSPVGPTVLTFGESGLAVSAAPEKIFTYRVRAQNADGLGAYSNAVILQWNSNVSGVPVAPTLLDRSNLTTAQVDLTWAIVVDSTVDKTGVFEGLASTTPIIDNLDPTATSYHWTGLVPGARHSNVNVRRHNSFGWSPASNAITFTVPTVAVVHDPAMGVPNNDEFGRLFYTQWDAVRTYDFSNAIADFNLMNPRVIGLTTTNAGFVSGGASSATALRNFLEQFYYTSAGFAGRQNCEIHFAMDNETDRGYTTGSLPASYINTQALCYDVVHTITGGTRRYPKASMWVDMTQRQIRANGAGPRFKPIAQYLDGMASSMYPPGRSQDPVIFTPYATYCDDVFTTLADWRATGGPGGTSLANQLTMFATWEWGIPIDHALKGTGNGQATALTNYTIRPRYATGGVDSTNHDWKGFLQYTLDALDAMGVSMREQIYWNQQSDPDMPNYLWRDAQPLANPDTEHAWHNWTPGTRLAHG